MAFLPTPSCLTRATPSQRLAVSGRRPAAALTSPAVAPLRMADVYNDGSMDEKNKKSIVHNSKEGDKGVVLCRCWKSATFPLCSGAHKKHNEECGDQVGPVIVKVVSAVE
eukprot:TRINITY_DN518_c0_g1_i2.p5 TRINITY_DN518_c0_g1~~TRINITY_DN518_c0_g1_i2.p5  ORF type:complete len:110 (+),score=39.63 TRINITY_DN518_c0_g1_i2:244-573(+)